MSVSILKHLGKRLLGPLAYALLGGIAVAEGPATICDTPFFPTTPMTGTFGSIVVPPGKNCDLANATVNGNVVGYEGSFVSLDGGVHVTGNVSQIDGFGFTIATFPSFATTPNVVDGNVNATGTTGNSSFVAVGICGATIGGNVQVTGTLNSVAFGGSEPGAACHSIGGGNHVPNGNVRIEGNAGLFFRVADNVVGVNLTIDENTGGATKRVLNNVVGKNLTCTDNDLPFVIGGNTAAKLIGQCQP